MVAALVLLLLLPSAPSWAQEAPAGRVLVLPDVTLSAEDPLYLAVPAAVGWNLAAPEQPPMDRQRLWAAEVPPRIRGLVAPPPERVTTPLPSSAPHPAGAKPGLLPGVTPGLQRGATPVAPGPPPDGPSSASDGAAAEAGLRLLYRTGTTAGFDLWLDRLRGSWETTASSAFTLSGELPSSFELKAAASLLRADWRGSLQVDGVGIVRPQAPGFLAGGLFAELRRDPAPFGMGSATRLLAEQPAEAGDAWLLLSQDLTGSWRGAHWALRAGGTAYAAMGVSTALHGLARLGLEWAGSALTVSAGASLLASEAGLRPYPEAAVELRPFPPLSLQAGLAAYLEQPAPFLVRETFGEGERLDLLPPAGWKARFAAVLDAPRTGGIGIALEAFEGERPLLRNGLLYLETGPHLAAEALGRLTLNPKERLLPRLTLSAEADAGIPLPISAQAFRRPLYGGLGAGLKVGFARWPAELILQARWGDIPVQGLSAWLAERRADDWQASLAVRWEVQPPLTVEAGLQAGAGLEGLAGCTLQARRSP